MLDTRRWMPAIRFIFFYIPDELPRHFCFGTAREEIGPVPRMWIDITRRTGSLFEMSAL
jgi:hypothetical protein